MAAAPRSWWLNFQQTYNVYKKSTFNILNHLRRFPEVFYKKKKKNKVPREIKYLKRAGGHFSYVPAQTTLVRENSEKLLFLYIFAYEYGGKQNKIIMSTIDLFLNNPFCSFPACFFNINDLSSIYRVLAIFTAKSKDISPTIDCDGSTVNIDFDSTIYSTEQHYINNLREFH